MVVNRSQGYSLNLVVERSDVIELLRRQLAEADLPVFALAQSRPSLDDVYLQATGRTLMDAELSVAGLRDPKAERRRAPWPRASWQAGVLRAPALRLVRR